MTGAQICSLPTRTHAGATKKAMEAVPPSSLKYIVINPTVCHTYGVTNFGEEDCGPGGN